MVGSRNSVGVQIGRPVVVVLHLFTFGVPEGVVAAAAISPCWATPSAAGCEDANVFCEHPPLLPFSAAVWAIMHATGL